MIGLVRAEAHRILARRLTRLLVGSAMAIIVVSAVITAIVVDTDYDPERGRLLAEQQMAAARANLETQCQELLRGEIVLHPGELPPGISLGDTLEECTETLTEVYGFGREIRAHDPRFHFTDLWVVDEFSEREDGQLGTVLLMHLLMALVAGASMVGAEWKAGTMGQLLGFEPRRGRVFGVKLATTVVIGMAITVAMVAFFLAVFWVVAATRGTTAGADADWWGAVAGVTARDTAMVGLAAAIGFAIASVARNTTASIVVAFAYFAVVENLIRGLLALMDRFDWHWWLLGSNFVIFLDGHDAVDLETGATLRTVPEAGMILAGYMAVLVAIAFADFRRRDLA